jgi:hypothetical protein
LRGAADTLLEAVGSSLPAQFESFRASYLGQVSELLAADAFQAALSVGRAMTPAQALQYALAATGPPNPPDRNSVCCLERQAAVEYALRDDEAIAPGRTQA